MGGVVGSTGSHNALADAASGGKPLSAAVCPWEASASKGWMASALRTGGGGTNRTAFMRGAVEGFVPSRKVLEPLLGSSCGSSESW
jgi:hypothetical protein